MTDRFERLITEVQRCRLCVDATDRPPLPHAPRPVLRGTSTARIAICGQAPGTRVHASGKPFTNPSGDRLRAWLGLDADTFYDARCIAIIPMGFCFPGLDAKGGDLPPRRECAPVWREKVFAELPALEVVLAIGQYAQRWHLGSRAGRSLTETVSHWRELTAQRHGAGPVVWPLPHPSWRNNAWLKRHPWFEADLLPELRGHLACILDDPTPTWKGKNSSNGS